MLSSTPEETGKIIIKGLIFLGRLRVREEQKWEKWGALVKGSEHRVDSQRQWYSHIARALPLYI